MADSSEDTYDEEKRKIAVADSIARLIMDTGMEDFAEHFFDVYGRIELIGQTAYLSWAPFLTMFWGDDGRLAANILGLEPKEGSKLILKQIEKVREERKQLGEYKRPSLKAWIKSYFRRIFPRI
ncbi:MAG: hypothetical protein QG670_2638 [Thermoproteota archaeon]|nr:hypothetical protein [Thermoproteota archaeon]